MNPQQHPRPGRPAAALLIAGALLAGLAGPAMAQPAATPTPAAATANAAEQRLQVLMRARLPNGVWREQQAELLLRRSATASETMLRLRPEVLDAGWFVELSAFQFEDGELRYEGRLLAGRGDESLAPPQALRPDGRAVVLEGAAPGGAGLLRVELSLLPR
ncbi:hypothetical protein G8A07_08485 [Roseateles sp. DAIF2]|uniref:hypothetical protein n=1 Tax=Roseateles sp. DAIF2 TaxID=2714952 RepID=UPI0018A24937|nr:hypothetical protein [Roseateles sp. DAIF2]QPF72962.1 hypothetical protein G8A07_08485 [Roseateles sp. DAIF2]